MIKLLFLSLTFLTLLVSKESIETTQGYAQKKSEACALSVEKALKIALEKDILSRCECYKQDGNDWLCYTNTKVER